MEDVIKSLGIYPDAIEKMVEVCECAMEEALDVVTDIDKSENYLIHYDVLRTDLNDAAKELMEDNFDFNEITNSIIDAYLKSTASILNDCQPLNDLGITFEAYTNCDDSHLNMRIENKSSYSVREFNEGELISVVEERLAKQVIEIAQEENIECTPEELAEYNLEDLYACIQNGELVGQIKDNLNPFEITCEIREIMKANESVYVIDLADKNLYEAVNRGSKNSLELTDLISEYGEASELITSDECPYEVYAEHEGDKVFLRLALLEHEIDVAVPLTQKEENLFIEKFNSFEEKENCKAITEKLKKTIEDYDNDFDDFNEWLKENAIISDNYSNISRGTDEDGYYENIYYGAKGIIQIDDHTCLCEVGCWDYGKPSVQSLEFLKEHEVESKIQNIAAHPEGDLSFSKEAEKYFPVPKPDVADNFYFIAEKPCAISVKNWNQKGTYEPAPFLLKVNEGNTVAVVDNCLEINNKKYENYEFSESFKRMPQLKQITKQERDEKMKSFKKEKAGKSIERD